VFELWLPITVAAAFVQNARSALQRELRSELSNSGATYVRFAFGVVFAFVYLGCLTAYLDQPLPRPGRSFFLYASLGGLAQILGTAALLRAVSLRSFAVGTAYSKTEPLQAAAFGFVLLGESVNAMGALALLISLIGVVVLALARSEFSLRTLSVLLLDRGAWVGLASGALFGVAAVCYRGASLSLETAGGVFLRAAFTLACVILFQTIVMTLYLWLREQGELGRVAKAWKPASWVGAFGALASVGWFTAMTLENAAYVRAVGQLELVFALGTSWLFFRERVMPLELAGIGGVVGGVLLLVLRG
jgi:drug/metabolite transporter (DMT)-like permease